MYEDDSDKGHRIMGLKKQIDCRWIYNPCIGCDGLYLA